MRICRNPLWKVSLFSMVAFQSVAFCFDDSEEPSLFDEYEDTLFSFEEDEEKFSDDEGDYLSETDEEDADFFMQDEERNATHLSFHENIGQQNPPPQKSLLALHSRLQVGGNYSYLTLQPRGHQTFTGGLGGMQALYEFRPLDRFYGAATFDWRQGSTHGPGGRRSILYYDGQERLGYTIGHKEWRWTLFSGFGYHQIRQTLKPKEGRSLRFTYKEFYIPLGMLSSYDVRSWFSVGLDFTWMPQIFSTVSIVPLKGAHWTLTNRINNFYVATPLTFSFTENKRFQILLNPFYAHWMDGHSTAKLADGNSLGLPGNRYNFFGVDLNFGYCF